MAEYDDECEALFDKAHRLMLYNHYREAAEMFGACLEQESDYPEAYGNRGVCYLNLGDDEAAARDFRRVLELDPEDAMGYAMLAEAMRNLGRYEEALQAAAEALERDPEEPGSYYVRGWLFAQAGQYPEATEDLEEYLDLMDDPGGVEELCDACTLFADPTPTDAAGRLLDTAEAKAKYLGQAGLSFEREYNSAYLEDGLFCPWAHCIRNQPRRCKDAPLACPVTSTDCPGGAEQVEICRARPPRES